MCVYVYKYIRIYYMMSSSVGTKKATSSHNKERTPEAKTASIKITSDIGVKYIL